MGPCLSKCIVNDIGNEFEAELDDARAGNGYHHGPETSKMASGPSGHSGGGGAAAAAQNAFGATSLLAADEVVCLNVLGEGASGVIYKGSYRGSVVAVKKMRMVALPAKPGAREVIESALEVEAARMGSLRHPNTVLFMGACLQGDYFCIVSEYCHLGSLFDVLRSRGEASAASSSRKQSSKSRRPPHALADLQHGNHSSSDGKKPRKPIKWIYRIRVAKSAAQGLLYLHSADPPLVHGMLKSTNILVDDSWNAKIADFGTRRVAEAVGFDRRRLENVDNETGLLRWTAPELLKLGEDRVLKGQVPSNNAFPQAVDIYSFGIIMWELTTGELPFGALTNNRDIRDHVVNGNRPPMGSDTCSVKWAELITRCWSSNPARRPTAAEIVSILEKVYEEEVQAKSQKKKVVNSNRADYTYARRDRPHKGPKSGGSKFGSNVRLPEE